MGVNPDIPSCVACDVVLVGILAIPGVTIHLTFTLDTHADPLLCKKACTGGARAPACHLAPRSWHAPRRVVRHTLSGDSSTMSAVGLR